MRRKTKEDEELDPVFVARWIAEGKALYCEELKRRAAAAGLSEYPEMLEKIRAAETEVTRHDTRARAREENRQATAGRKGKTQ